ncbi:helix-turn-helix domain-containing protein [Chitinibacteraceae bacterium HSL-7]
MDNGFCERFGLLIAALNISQNEFARQLGSTSAFVSNMARGKSKPGLEFLQKIAETFGVSLDWLVLGKGTLHGDQYLDPEWLHTALLRVALAQLAATGNTEARALAEELLGTTPASPVTTPARQALLDELATKTSHGPLLATLYNRYLPVADVNQRSKEILRAALQQLQPSSSDPLAALLTQTKPTTPPPATTTQILIGVDQRNAGRDYNKR